jgi:hypothetical protein
MIYLFGSYFDTDSAELDPGFGAGFPRPMGRALLRGPVFARLDKAPAELRERIPWYSPTSGSRSTGAGSIPRRHLQPRLGGTPPVDRVGTPWVSGATRDWMIVV